MDHAAHPQRHLRRGDLLLTLCPDSRDGTCLAWEATASSGAATVGGDSGGSVYHDWGDGTVGARGIVGETVVEQFERALTNLLTALRAAGGEPGTLVSLTIYLLDMEDYKAHAREIGDVWKRLAGRDYPAMAGVGVTRLWDVEALVEVQGVAVLPG